MIGKSNTGGENVTPEVTTQTPIIQNITEALVGKATGANATEDTILEGYSAWVAQQLIHGKATKSGLYAWKKYTTVENSLSYVNPSFTVSLSSGVARIEISNANFDLTLFQDFISWQEFFKIFSSTTGRYFNGSKFVLNSLGDYISITSFVVTSSSTGYFTTAMHYNTLTATMSYSGTYSLSSTAKTYLGYVVSDQSTTYPDNGIQDGYLYEKFEPDTFGCTNYAVDKVTFSSESYVGSVAVSHSLGIIPKIAIITVSNISDTSYVTTGVGLATSGGNFRSIILTGNRNYIYGNSSANTATSSEVTFQGTASTQIYKSGVEYTLITMA